MGSTSSSERRASRFARARANLAPVLDAFFPPRCGGCRRFESALFCSHCARFLRPLAAPFCARCGCPLDPLAKASELCATCRKTPPHFEAARAAWMFTEPLKTAIHRFKYRGHHAYARRLAPILALKWDADAVLSDWAPDWIAAVPLHPSRMRTRGFNQSALLARELAALRDVRVWNGLRRTRATPPQVGLNANARAKNVRGAFEVSGASEIAGARVLLVDDVFTTGATLDECARALRRAGAAGVCALTLARQGHPDEELLVPPHRASWSPF